MSKEARTRHNAAVVLAVGALALALLLSPASAGAAASRAEYAQQADPICKDASQDWTRLWKRFLRADEKLGFHAVGSALASIGTTLSAMTVSSPLRR
jgi:hypothetical protein